jgi:diaphanous 1
MDVVCKAIEETRTSKRLKPLLEVVLALGNHLNGSTARGGAYGFKLDSLTKLGDVKTIDGSQTVNHYLASLVDRDYPDLGDIIDDFTAIGNAARESVPNTEADLMKLKNELAQVKRELDDAQPGDRLTQVLGPFFEKANSQLQDALAQMVGLKEDWATLAQYYGEQKTADSQSFFETLNHFVTNFDVCCCYLARSLPAACMR